MNISSIKLLGDGRHGVEVGFMRTSVGDGGYRFADEYIVKFKTPASGSIRELFSFFNKYFKSLLCFDENSDVCCFKINTGLDDFKLWAHVGCGNGKQIDISGPKVSSEHLWQFYNQVINIVDRLHKEIILYIEGKSKVDVRQVVIDFVENEEVKAEKMELTRDMVNAMSKEEISDWAARVLEDHGCIILKNE